VKRISRNYKKIAIVIFTLLFAFPSISLALDKSKTRELPVQINVPCDKTWTVKFNEAVSVETIVPNNIFINDSKGCKIDIKLELNEDEKSVNLIPISKYSVGEKYRIYVKSLIENKAGNKVLKNDLKMCFTVSSKVMDLPVVGTEAKLRELLNSAYNYNIRYMEKSQVDQPTAENSSAAGNYSNTNTQVMGVDEGDSVKTDGVNIYRINNQTVEIFKASPVGEMKILDTIQFNENDNDSFYPTEIYVDSSHMVVIGSYNNRSTIQMSKEVGTQEVSSVAKMASPYLWKNTVKVLVYDISDINNIKEIRKVEVDGYTLSTRKIGKMLYVVSNQNLHYYREDIDNITPGYVDSAVGSEYLKIDYKDIHYLKDSVQASYLMLTGVNLEDANEPANMYTCLGNGSGIYMSKENLYITAQDNNRYNNTFTDILPEATVDKTNIYKFKIEEGKFEFVAKGQVKGTVLNQFSMDENNEYFRVATTTNPIWNFNGEGTTKNNVYILDKELKLSGKLEDIAMGERIYSVRFVGEKGYVVTFKNIDPLFVIDLKDVRNPTILGELKIPGFSSYIQPYDEKHLIGIGMDTQEVDGRVTTKGVKLSLFDVTDYKNPKEKFSTVIGDAGTHSEVLNNHKALLFSKEKNILAFPISVVKNQEDSENKWIYGKEVFQGAYVYNVDLENGFKLRGELTHLSPKDFNNDNYESIYNRNVQRILYINDSLYTISNDVIMANDFNDLSMKNIISKEK
jgi:inhibitor of cysteine peptidase